MLDKRSVAPLYYQLASILRDSIQTGAIRPGELLPSERELMQEYGVSRNTVRHAVDILVSDGLAYRDHGRGNFVLGAGISIRCKIDVVAEHSELLRCAGFEPMVRPLSSELMLPSEAVRQALELAQGEQVIRFTKLFLADGRPAILTYDHVPAKYLPSGYDQRGSGQAFFEFLESFRRRPVEFVLSEIVPTSAKGEIAQLLSCAEGTPLMLLNEAFLDYSQREPLCLAHNYYHPDLVHFRILRRRERSS